MIALASEDGPDVLCLQEIPAWALPRLAAWSGMTAAAIDVAARAPLGAWLGRWITRLDNALLRAAFAGQGNAILVARRFRPLERRTTVLNPWRLRRRLAVQLGLGVRARVRWASERRLCQLVRVADGERTLTIANLHVSNHPDVRLRDAELERAFAFVGMPRKPTIFAGDFNRSPGSSEVFRTLIERSGFGPAGPRIDHVLVRGAPASEPLQWPEERRRLHGRLLSDHAPVEVRLDL